MTQFTLTLLDTTGIQDYIFARNRLQENIGASELVFRATSLWVFEAFEKAGIKSGEHNISNPTSLDWDYNDKWIEDDKNLKVEVIQAAGGNTLLLFREKGTSRLFVNHLTRRLLKDAPGLIVLAQHWDNFNFDPKDLTLPAKLKELETKMQKHKLNRVISTPTMGLGVTSVCASTGLPAVVTLAGEMEIEGNSEQFGLKGEEPSTHVSAQVAAKRAWRRQANIRLEHDLHAAADDYIFPYDLDKIGRIKGEESYVAVIHADGNHMSRHVAEATAAAKTNRDWIRDRRIFSKILGKITQDALNSVVSLVVQAVKKGDIPFEENEGKKYLPFRPLVFGGDDVTFVCSGLIGVSLATAYLEAFEQAASEHGKDLFASAGISIVKLHYPFARAYQLSEELAKSAKTLNRNIDCSALDWHFAQSGLSGRLESIRKREFTSDTGQPLVVRPLKLKESQRSWEKFEIVLDKFQNDYWSKKRNKVVGLREPLRKGPTAVEHYRLNFDLELLPEIAGKEAQKMGWQDGVCYYFDAIELMDHYVPLKNKEVIK